MAELEQDGQTSRGETYMAVPDPNPADLLPLKPLEFSILLALAEDDLHGYGIAKRISDRDVGGVDLAPGNLYAVLDRLIGLDLIEAMRKRAGERKREYRITSFGREVAAAEAVRLQVLVGTAKRLAILPRGGGA
jgi:DNA-binding PadR family transcriptional regulator